MKTYVFYGILLPIERNNMQLSQEQAEKFYDIVKNLLSVQQKAEQMIGHMQRSGQPYAATAYEFIANSFNPLTKFIYEELDFKRGVDYSQLEKFNELYNNMTNDLSHIKSSALGEYAHDEYTWDPMRKLDVGITDFLKETQELHKSKTQHVPEQQMPMSDVEKNIIKEHQENQNKQPPLSNIEQTAIKEPKKEEQKPINSSQMNQDKQMGAETVFALTDVLKKGNDFDPNSFDNMWAGLREANDKGLLSEQMKQEYRDILSWAKDGGISKTDATQRLKKILLDQLDVLDKTSLVQSQYKSLDVINKAKDFVAAYNEFNTNGDFGSAQYELEKLSRYIGSSAREGLISNGIANDYRRIIKQAYLRNDEKVQKQATDELIKISDMHKNRIIYGQQTAIKEPKKEESKAKIEAFEKGQQILMNKQKKQNRFNDLYYMEMQQRRNLGNQ
ncbi:MAG: hypothetical protein IJE79_05550 [Alphaproteobacteria bacterium]|nr:hypothetical protein [Alphaproteobacteria bacterium]